MHLEVNGTRREVALRRAGRAWVADVDGRAHTIDLERLPGRWSMLVAPAVRTETSSAGDEASCARSYEVVVDVVRPGELIVYLRGHAIPVTVAGPRAAGAAGPRDAASRGAGPRPVVAPMPGRVVKLLVAAGEAVAAGQPLVVVEAMKMENELRSPITGTVTSVRVATGAAVEAGTVLLVVE